ncbi:hypothetical protein ACHMWU_22805 [Aeromicrobium sp. UC242_57]
MVDVSNGKYVTKQGPRPDVETVLTTNPIGQQEPRLVVRPSFCV